MQITRFNMAARCVSGIVLAGALAVAAVAPASASADAGSVSSQGTITSGKCQPGLFGGVIAGSCQKYAFAQPNDVTLSPYSYATPCHNLIRSGDPFGEWETIRQREFLHIDYHTAGRGQSGIWANIGFAIDRDCNGTFEKNGSTRSNTLFANQSQELTLSLSSSWGYLSPDSGDHWESAEVKLTVRHGYATLQQP